jgi:aryl-phospho-beta-D-glucosidase BglC (GH1 family)
MPTWLYPSVTSPTTGEEVAAAVCSFFMDQSLVGTRVPSPIDGLVAAEQMFASRYANNPTVVGLDIFNEPWFSRSCGNTATVAQLLVNFDAKISTAISTANPRLLIVFEDPPHGLMPQLTFPLITSPPEVPNAVYEVHIYVSNWGVAHPLLEAYFSNAKKWGIPLYLGEFDAFEAGNNAIYATVDPNWQADTQSMLAYCKTNNISWSYWSYTSLGTKVPTPVPKTEILSVLQGGV